MKVRLATLLLSTLLGACATLGPDFVVQRTDWDYNWTSATLAGLVVAAKGALILILATGVTWLFGLLLGPVLKAVAT